MNRAFLCDENVPRRVVLRLREAGLDVVWISEGARGATDVEVLAQAAREHRVLITFDKDFGEMAARSGAAGHGVILLRLREVSPARLPDWLAGQISARSDWPGHFSVIEDDRIRMRPLS